MCKPACGASLDEPMINLPLLPPNFTLIRPALTVGYLDWISENWMVKNCSTLRIINQGIG